MNDYQEQALRTKSDQFHADRAQAWMFAAVLDEIIEHTRNLDALKKALFYGKPIPPGIFSELVFQCGLDDPEIDGAAARMADLDPDVVHGLVGVVTEAGELAEMLYRWLRDGEAIAPGKAAEEIGDLMWYQALLLRALGYGFSRVQQMNINKLRKRYPEKFSSELALERRDER